MKLTIIVDDKTIPVELPASAISDAKPVFEKMDADMQRGWQMSRTWVESPDTSQRCQIVADKLLTAIENGNQAGIGMFSAYILSRLEGVTSVDIDTSGDMNETRFSF